MLSTGAPATKVMEDMVNHCHNCIGRAIMKDLRVVDLCPELVSLAFLLLELALRSGLRSDIVTKERENSFKNAGSGAECGAVRSCLASVRFIRKNRWSSNRLGAKPLIRTRPTEKVEREGDLR